MNIKKFRVWNYKSIIDSEDCYPSQGVTVLAGKNEAGKTSLLEALEDFNPGQSIREKAIPIQSEDNKPRISIWFDCPKGDLEEIFQKIGHSHEVKDESVEIHLEKHYPNIYVLGDETSEKLGFSDSNPVDLTAIEEQAKTPLETIVAIFNSQQPHLANITNPSFDVNNLPETKTAFEKLRSEVEPILPNIPDPDQSALKEHIQTLINLSTKAIQDSSVKDKFVKEFQDYFPNFILFSSFNDVFPNTVPLADLEKNEWIEDLAIISDLDISIVKSANDRRKIDHKTKLNINLNKDFERFWEQDLSKLSVDWDNEKLYFWIEEDGFHYEPEIRSQGRKWHLAFYIRVTARAKEEYRNVILIDEPGLYLHAKAQRDILNKLEEAAEDAQIIFSTHSPYLIEADKLDRVRLVQKTTKKGTVIENKIHKVADKETLTPIMTAIGLEMTDSITQIDKVNNVVVEGPSDYYYLQAFKKLTNLENINFIYGGGSGNMPKIGTILQGWGCNVIYLYDNDQGLKDALKNIKAEWVTTTQEMLTKIPVEGAIENIFSQGDYKKYVLGDEQVDLKVSNSDYAKSAKRDKVLDAKLFLESIRGETISIDKTTESNISKLLDNIKAKFSN